MIIVVVLIILLSCFFSDIKDFFNHGGYDNKLAFTLFKILFCLLSLAGIAAYFIINYQKPVSTSLILQKTIFKSGEDSRGRSMSKSRAMSRSKNRLVSYNSE